MSNLVSIGRESTDVKLFDTKGGIVKLYKSLTVDNQSELLRTYGGKEDSDSKLKMALETIVKCFMEWNIGKDGAALPCNQETLGQFSQRDLFAMLQACTGKALLDDEGNLLSEEEAAKKAARA